MPTGTSPRGALVRPPGPGPAASPTASRGSTVVIRTAPRTRPAPRTAPRSAPALMPWALVALGLCLVAVAFLLGRQGQTGTGPRALFWAGLALIVAPVAARLLSGAPSRAERVSLIALFGLATYAVKVLHDPTIFTRADEFVHLAATQQLVATHHLSGHANLGGANVASGFPGLHLVAAAIGEVTGLNLMASGIVTIAVARVVMMLALFGLLERVTRSASLACLGALLYAGNANFLYWSSQFAYQSLALPLLVLTLFVVAIRAERGTRQPGLTLLASALILATAFTHHLSSYGLAAILWGLTAASLRPGWRKYRVPGLAVLATTAAVVWFLTEARGTSHYLSFVAGKTWRSVTAAAGGGAQAPFGGGAGVPTPRLEELLGLGAAGLVVLGVLAALLGPGRHLARRSPLATGLVLAGIAFVPFYGLKLFPGAWETANRAQELLFLGTGLLLALALPRLRAARPGRSGVALAIAAITVVIGGAAVQGWPSAMRLPEPVEVRAGGGTIVPQNLQFVRWARATLPHDAVFATDEVTGRELAVAGVRFAYVGSSPGFGSILQGATLPPWERDLLRDKGVDYVVLDRRQLAGDAALGYFFQPEDRPDGGLGYYPAAARAKFAAIPGLPEVFDSGDLVAYDVRGLHATAPACDTVPAAVRASGDLCHTAHAAFLKPADGAGTAVQLPGLGVSTRLLDGEHLVVTLRNSSTTPYVVAAGGGGLTLSVDRTSYAPRLGSALRLTAGQQLTRTLSFRLPAAARRYLRRRGGTLGVPLPDQTLTAPRQLRGLVDVRSTG